MYQPRPFIEHDLLKAMQLVKQSPLGTLIINSEEGFEVNHIPFVIDLIKPEVPRLRAHIPRSNSLSSILTSEQNGVVTFNGADGYISPSWYATKKQHGKVVPTWNYSVVHVHGKIVVKDDPEWVRSQLHALTSLNENLRSDSWAISDAPDDFISMQIRALVGLELIATKVEAKTKASQNQPQINQMSVLQSLQSEQPDSALTAMMESTLQRPR